MEQEDLGKSVSNEVCESDGESVGIQAKKVKIDRRKKGNHERTEAQKLAFEKAKKIRDGRRQERANVKIEEEQKKKKEMEERILKKAVSIKKKQIVREALLEEISDEEIPMEVIKKIQKRLPARQTPIKNQELPPQQPQYLQPQYPQYSFF
jgi:hypothetical protein